MEDFDAEVNKLLIEQDDPLLPTESILINKKEIDFDSIHTFHIKSIKSKNDKNNKIRENIINGIINKKIPDSYYENSKDWKNLRDEVEKYLKKLVITEEWINIDKIECISKGGRKYKYDYEIIFHFKNQTTKLYNIEFKYGAETVTKCPQWVSPMKPSQYLSSSYEDYYYDNYLTSLSLEFNLQLPNKETYLKQVHGNLPNSIREYQIKYYKGCKRSSRYSEQEDDIKFYKRCLELSKESIEKFIDKTDLDKIKLSEYLATGQKNKVYMLYFNNEFHLEESTKNYEIIEVKKNSKLARYECTLQNGIIINVLLRWKNGNGIAYPAFQIS